jgi:hypothetical protein
MNLCSYAHLSFGLKEPKTYDGEKSLFNKCCWENWISACRKLKLDPCFSPCTNINSKWIKDASIRPETFKQLPEVMGNTLEHIGIGNDFLNGTPMAQQIKEKTDKWDCIKLRHSPQNGRKSLPAIHPIRD